MCLNEFQTQYKNVPFPKYQQLQHIFKIGV